MLDALRSWQQDDLPLQLHPGDIGWFWRFGAERVAAATRLWLRGDRIVAVGLLDGPDVLRMALDPDYGDDSPLAEAIVADCMDPTCGVFPAGPATIEARFGDALARTLAASGWRPGDPWATLSRALDQAMEPAAIRTEIVTSERVADRVAV